MNLIDQRFAELKAGGKTAVVPFLTVGDPNPETTVDIIIELEQAGADIIELGVPYSDPLADGPVIQRASGRALRNHLTIIDCIRVAKQAREKGCSLPFVLFTYFNPALQLGLDRLFALLVEHDVSGLLIPDLPLEEDEEVKRLASLHGIHLIPLVAPTSHERIARITSRASGFIYCVSSLGVTGERSSFHEGIEQFLASVRSSTSLPIAVGFGISTNEQVRRFAEMADGVIIGSAIVRKIEQTLPLLQDDKRRKEGLLQIRDFVASLVK